MVDKLDSILEENSERKTEKSERDYFTKLCITKDAYEKAKIYADLSRNSWSQHVECYGFLISSSDRRNKIVEDVYFANEQDAGYSNVKISGESVQKAGEEIAKRGKRIIGWWHSHPDFRAFHSRTDDDNLVTVFNQIAPVNYLKIYTELCFPVNQIKKANRGDRLLIEDENDRRLVMLFDKDIKEDMLERIRTGEIIVRIPVKIAYAYSLVVSVRNKEPYAEVSFRRNCDLCRDYENYSTEEIPVEVLDYKSGLKLDKKEMKKEVESKLRCFSYSYFSPFGRKKTKRKDGEEKDLREDDGFGDYSEWYGGRHGYY